MAAEGRTPRGTFAAGNPGGPGRPRRKIEADYLKALTETVPPGRWRRIVERAAADAEAGDATARSWLGRFLLGAEAPTLKELAIQEASGQSLDELVERGASERRWTIEATKGLCQL